MGSSYGDRGSAVTGIFVRNWIKADGFLKPQTSVIRFSPLNTDWRMIALDDTRAEKHSQKQARFEQRGRIVVLSALSFTRGYLYQTVVLSDKKYDSVPYQWCVHVAFYVIHMLGVNIQMFSAMLTVWLASVYDFVPDWKSSTNTGRIAVKFYTDICDSLTISLVSKWGLHFKLVLSEISI